MEPLEPYQERARDFLIDRLYVQGEQGAGLFLDPGLGKTRITLESLAFLKDVGEISRTLVVAPLRVCATTWLEEPEKWKIPLRVRSLCGLSEIPLRGRPDIDLINPDSIHKIIPVSHRYDCIVVDESTGFKNWSGSKGKRKRGSNKPRRGSRMPNLRKMLKQFKKRIILSGTPAANSLMDLFSQIFILDGGAALGKNVTVFRAAYCEQGGYQGREWHFRESMAHELYSRIAPMVLRMDAETELDMPELVTHDMEGVLPAEARREYNRLKKELLAQLESGDILAMNAASAYVKCRQFTNGAIYDAERSVHEVHTVKLDMLDELIDELAGKPLLAFYQFSHDKDRILARHPKARVLNGKTPPGEALKSISDWNCGRVSLFLVQIAAGSHGLNLQHGPCADVAYFGLTDSAEKYDQSFRRVYRRGQKSKRVRVHRLLCRDTVDGIMAARVAGKFQTQNQFFEALKGHCREQ